MSDVKDRESQVLWALEKTPNKKTLSFILNPFSTIFKKEKWNFFWLIATTFLLLKLTLLDFVLI